MQVLLEEKGELWSVWLSKRQKRKRKSRKPVLNAICAAIEVSGPLELTWAISYPCFPLKRPLELRSTPPMTQAL